LGVFIFQEQFDKKYDSFSRRTFRPLFSSAQLHDQFYNGQMNSPVDIAPYCLGQEKYKKKNKGQADKKFL